MNRRVAVVGGGCSGAMVAATLLQTEVAWDGITVFESTARALGGGMAYSTTDPAHLLNVCDNRMGAYASDPSGFARWVAQNDLPPAPFQPRRLFGAYITETLATAAESSPIPLTRYRQRVVDIARSGASWVVTTSDETRHAADMVVLAVGWLPPRMPAPLQEMRNSARYVHQPSEPDGLRNVAPGDDVFVLGSGLTAVDAALTLHGRGHRGRILMGSRHALLPQIADESGISPATARIAGRSVRQMARILRVLAATRTTPADAVPALREQTPALWRSLSIEERRRFLRHCQRLWEVNRHCIAPSVAATIEQLRSSGQLEVRRCRLMSAQDSRHHVTLELLEHDNRGALRNTMQRVHHVLNCTGPTVDVRHTGDRLLRALIDSCLAQPDPLGLGLRTDDQGALIGRDGAVIPTLRCIGPMRKAECWESTAVPELRMQAEELARALSERDRVLSPLA